jgi:hypothetical protein
MHTFLLILSMSAIGLIFDLRIFVTGQTGRDVVAGWSRE